MLAKEWMKTPRTTEHYDSKDVTRTELSADPVKKMGKVGCQSTAVIGAPWESVLQPFKWPWTWKDSQTLPLSDN